MFEDKECFCRSVWYLQCLYGKQAYKYKWRLILGSKPKELKRKLTLAMNMLNILNAYDTRDIDQKIHKYNKMTEKQIYNIVVKLKQILS